MIIFCLDGHCQNITCYRTDGPRMTTCEISQTNREHWCYVQCEDTDGIFLCSQDCVHNTPLLCDKNITNAHFVHFCCKQPLCNNFTGEISPPSSSSSSLQSTYTPSPSGKWKCSYFLYMSSYFAKFLLFQQQLKTVRRAALVTTNIMLLLQSVWSLLS